MLLSAFYFFRIRIGIMDLMQIVVYKQIWKSVQWITYTSFWGFLFIFN